MNDGPLQFTMRELRSIFFAPMLWVAIVGAALLLGLVGPFGTFDTLRVPARIAYWLAIAVSTYFAGVATSQFLARWLGRRWALPMPLLYAACGAISGIPVTLVVAGINRIVFGPEDPDFGLAELAAYCVVISAIVSCLVAAFSAAFERARAGASDAEAQRQRPRILDRLPAGLRGELTHMSMQDHYVDIRTDRGGSLVLMRLADAIAETRGVEGLQIHRSHWVAKHAVERMVRKDGRLFVRLRGGVTLPVSRSYVAAVRAAGLG